MTNEVPLSSADQELPKLGALLGVDYGTRRIGIATCNREQTIAVPVETWTRRTPELDAKHFRELIDDYRVQGIVIGLPLMTQSGTESRQAAITRQFGKWLHELSHLPIDYFDERYSSAAAETLLWSRGESPGKNKSRLDGLAAQIILQGYLDQRLRTADSQ